ncbi:MAG: hypothetical protein ACRDD2_08445 [Sarcina sp.]
MDKNEKVLTKKGSKAMAGTRTQYEIPTFSFKGSIIILCFAILGTLVVPTVLSFLGVSFKLGAIIGNVLVTAYGIAYVRCFVESKIGYCKKFYVTYVGFSVAFGIISVFWLYLNTYI